MLKPPLKNLFSFLSLTRTNETAGDGKLEVISLSKKRDDLRKDGAAADLALGILGNDARSYLDLVSKLEDTAENRATSNATLEDVDFGAGLVDVKRTDNNETGRCFYFIFISSKFFFLLKKRIEALPSLGLEVTDWDGDSLDNVLADGVDIVAELGRDGDDGGAVGDSALDKVENLLVLLLGSGLLDQINLVLEDDDVSQLHDLDGRQVLRCLWLRAGLH